MEPGVLGGGAGLVELGGLSDEGAVCSAVELSLLRDAGNAAAGRPGPVASELTWLTLGTTSSSVRASQQPVSAIRSGHTGAHPPVGTERRTHIVRH